MFNYSNLFSNPSNPNEDKFNGYVMSGDYTVAEVKNNQVTSILDEQRCPLYLLRTQDFEGWLETRCIDLHRTNSRVLRKALRLQNVNEVSLVLKVKAMTITDNYWCKPSDSDELWEDVKFSEDVLADMALFGMFREVDEDTITPELTNIGSFEKCWKFDGFEWFMVKHANDRERYSEMYIQKLGEYFGYSMAEYFYYDEENISTHDFTDEKYNFEPIHSLVGDDVDYDVVIDCLKKLGDDFVKDYFKIIFLDALSINPDRHEFNFGLLRDLDTGEILKLAPNFDNNLALISMGIPKVLPTVKNVMVRDFIDAVKNNPGYFELPSLTLKDLSYVRSTVNAQERYLDLGNFDVEDFIYHNYLLIKNELDL